MKGLHTCGGGGEKTIAPRLLLPELLPLLHVAREGKEKEMRGLEFLRAKKSKIQQPWASLVLDAPVAFIAREIEKKMDAFHTSGEWREKYSTQASLVWALPVAFFLPEGKEKRYGQWEWARLDRVPVPMGANFSLSE